MLPADYSGEVAASNRLGKSNIALNPTHSDPTAGNSVSGNSGSPFGSALAGAFGNLPCRECQRGSIHLPGPKSRFWCPLARIGLRLDSRRVLTPNQEIPPHIRPYSILAQRFITTLTPAASADAAAASWRRPSCIQITLGLGSSASTSST